jgi:hypothetical protein
VFSEASPTTLVLRIVPKNKEIPNVSLLPLLAATQAVVSMQPGIAA